MQIRLDLLAAQAGGFSREYARECVEKGMVAVNGSVVTKPGAKFPADAELVLSAPTPRYVSRGGYKLEKALAAFGIGLEGRVCLDAGASTGGFTDCMLQHGAALVHAIDGGTSQLAASLAADSRVLPRERTDIRTLNPGDLTPPPDFCAADLSFISLTKVLPHILPLMAVGAELVLLIKPQFEAGRAQVGGSGIVRRPEVHRRVLRDILGFVRVAGLGLYAAGLDYSPIKGGGGNIEYLLYARATAPERAVPLPDIGELVTRARAELR